MKKQIIYVGERDNPSIEVSYIVVHENGIREKDKKFQRIAGISYSRLIGYLEGATAYKTPDQLEIINGIPKDKEVHNKYNDIYPVMQHRLTEIVEAAGIKEFLKTK